MNNFFVKFVPWNEQTLSSIINKTVKLSTVYEFNDFNEYGYIFSKPASEKLPKDEITRLGSILEKEITSPSFLKNLRTYSSEVCNEETIEKIAYSIDNGRAKDLLNPEKNCLSLLCQNLAFSKVGIFCTSDLTVFDDDSAQLMFAHYAQNLKGIVLIYETPKKTFEKVNYDSPIRFSNDMDKILEWCDGNYQNMNNFLRKSKKWGYEKERRIFGKPEITPTKELNIKLRAILYTPRFSGEEKTLHEINNNFYGGKLKIKKIIPSHSEHYFKILERGKKVRDFLEETFSITPKTHNFNVREASSSDIYSMKILSELQKIEKEEKEQPYQYSGSDIINIDSFPFRKILEDEQCLIYVAKNCSNNALLGFIIGKLIQDQEAYNPGRVTLRIDGFCVMSEDLWKTVGAELIKSIKTHAKEKNANQILIECGAHDTPKENFLNGQKLSLVSHCFLGNIS